MIEAAKNTKDQFTLMFYNGLRFDLHFLFETLNERCFIKFDNIYYLNSLKNMNIGLEEKIVQ